MPREISAKSMRMIPAIKEQIDKIYKLDGEPALQIRMGLYLSNSIGMICDAMKDTDYIGASEEIIKETGAWALLKNIPVFINSTEENIFGSPDTQIVGKKHIITIDRDEKITIENVGQ